MDWWYLAAIILVLLATAADIVVPTLLARPAVDLATALSDEDDGSQAAPVLSLPSVAWPILAAVLGMAAVGIAVGRMFADRQVEGRWLGLLAAAGVTVLWSVAVAAAVSKAHRTLAGLMGGQ